MPRRLGVALVAALVAGALALASWPFVQHWLQGRDAAAAQADLAARLPARPAADAPAVKGPAVARPVAAGEPLATMRIPRLGEDWSWVVVEGTGDDELAQGPGHYAGTPLPGARGNVAVAGHRAGHGDPFLDFDRLRVGDLVHLEQAGRTWTYRLSGEPVVVPETADWVLEPLPGRQLTLTTCWPKWGSAKRMFVRGELVEG